MDKRRWKTLRDFVDERAIEDLLDTIERDRQELDVGCSISYSAARLNSIPAGDQDILRETSDYPESLATAIDKIKNMVPAEVVLPSFDTIFASQEETSTRMAEHLESLAHHYDNMSNAMHDYEAGEEFHDEDMEGMNCVPSLYITSDISKQA